MVFVPRFLRPASFLPAALLLLAMAATGCEDKHIGRPCEAVPGLVPQPSPGTTAIINSAALECPSRICLLPAVSAPGRTTGPTCSAECSDDSDCDDYEKRGKEPSDRRCEGSYVCRVATNLGGFACRKLCMCNDFITTDSGSGACTKVP